MNSGNKISSRWRAGILDSFSTSRSMLLSWKRKKKRMKMFTDSVSSPFLDISWTFELKITASRRIDRCSTVTESSWQRWLLLRCMDRIVLIVAVRGEMSWLNGEGRWVGWTRWDRHHCWMWRNRMLSQRLRTGDVRVKELTRNRRMQWFRLMRWDGRFAGDRFRLKIMSQVRFVTGRSEMINDLLIVWWRRTRFKTVRLIALLMLSAGRCRIGEHTRRTIILQTRKRKRNTCRRSGFSSVIREDSFHSWTVDKILSRSDKTASEKID